MEYIGGADVGGTCTDCVVIADAGTISAVMRAKGLAVPMSLGLFGGLPGCTIGVALHRGLPVGAPGEPRGTRRSCWETSASVS